MHRCHALIVPRALPVLQLFPVAFRQISSETAANIIPIITCPQMSSAQVIKIRKGLANRTAVTDKCLSL